jgi:hypothetical protein
LSSTGQDNCRSPIDNNIAENALRTCCLGRKNFLFMGADSGGERAATMYSLIVSAKLNGIDPQAYLRHVLTHIADYPVNRVADLLPWNVADQLHLPSRLHSSFFWWGRPVSSPHFLHNCRTHWSCRSQLQ